MTCALDGIESNKASSEHRNKYRWNLFTIIYSIQVYVQDVDKRM